MIQNGLNAIGKIGDSSYTIRSKRRDAGIKTNNSSVYEAASWPSLPDQIQIAESPLHDETSSSTLSLDSSNEAISQTREPNAIFPFLTSIQELHLQSLMNADRNLMRFRNRFFTNHLVCF